MWIYFACMLLSYIRLDYSSCGKVDGRDPVAIDKAQSEIDAGRRMVSGMFV